MRFQFFKLAILVLAGHSSFSQSDISSPLIDLYQKAPASPAAASIGKYQDFPVNMAYGLPTIEFNLFTIQSGNINVPITLRYHAGGIKVNEIASWVGMGWSLSAGGSITRSINGLDDFYSESLNNNQYFTPDYSGYNSQFNTNFSNMGEVAEAIMNPPVDPNPLQRFIGKITQGQIDGEADEYFFSTPEGGGKMFYNQALGEFQINKRNGWKAQFSSQTQDLIDGTWSITGSNGIGYGFSAIELIRNPLVDNPQMNPNAPVVNQYNLPSAWHLTDIGDYINGKSVQFYYNSPWYYTSGPHSMYWEFGTGGALRGSSQSQSLRYGQELTISHITFDQGRVEFIQDASPRYDHPGKALKEIRVLDNNNKEVKRIVFSYFYDVSSLPNGQPDNDSKILFLDSFQEVYTLPNGTTVSNPPHKFTYDFTHHVPRRFCFAQDSWGYFNGQIDNATLIPDDILVAANTSHAGQGADRSVDVNYAKAGMLKEIEYPTGGKANFEFESNSANGTITGGLRIKQITNTDPNSQSTLTTAFEYKDENGNPNGERLFSPKYYHTYLHIYNGGGEQVILKAEGQPIYPLFPYQSSPVLYPRVIKKIVDGVEELISTHYFTIPSIEGIPEGEGVPYNKITIDDKAGGLEYRTEIYKKDPGNNYSLIEKKSQDWVPLNNYNEKLWNIQTAWATHGSGLWAIWDYNDPYMTTPNLNMYVKTNLYPHYRESIVPTESKSWQMDGTRILENTVNYEYDVSNGNQKKVISLNSEGDEIVKEIKYAADYAVVPASSVPLNQMIQDLMENNMNAAPVEVTTWIKKAGTSAHLLTSATFFEYSSGKVKKVHRLYLAEPIGDFQHSTNDANGFYMDSRYKAVQEVTQFDIHRNPMTVISDSRTESYIWDYSGAFPIAVVQEASHSEIAYTSFETTSGGSWSISGGTYSGQFALTGSKCFILGPGNYITRNGLPSGNYLVTYWSRSGSLWVNGAQGTAKLTKGGWTYYEHSLTNINTVTVSGNGTIDELRLYPAGKMMSTMSYAPLIGITSQCDPNNKVLYYEYDRFNRLVLIRDDDDKVIKKICYNYKGQTENCNSIYRNTEQSQSFVRNDCPSCSSGSTVIYTVASGTYTSEVSQAEADQLALLDISQNGQAFANTNGTCSSSSGDVVISFSNTLNYGSYDVVYTNNSTAQVYTFTIPNSPSGTVGCIPAGSYSLQIMPTGGGASPYALFGTGCAYQSGTSAYFTKVVVGSTDCNLISIEPDL